MTLHVVIGPPAAGKSTWVNDRAKPGDIVVDYDRIANALTSIHAEPHGHRRPHATVAFRAREAAITEALRHVKDHDVYIIHSVPKPQAMTRYEKHGAEIVVLDPGRDVVEARCRAERPENYMDGVKRWYRSGLRPRPAPRQAPANDTAPQGAPRPAAGSRVW
ncbi:hypothetical protein DEJ49_33450 [Streptomyces venezuelae]|uniref:ATP-binding protein n=1 Tax=Streptomyces venezuelae TaxID=54571 RepID=A0A5P2CTB7_STRVZ|nr:hypothetical protein [Streptomyces venezuelae]QES45247.1 hypothetical protein DEJ49_33450 [Streptomyces venezuelae]